MKYEVEKKVNSGDDKKAKVYDIKIKDCSLNSRSQASYNSRDKSLHKSYSRDLLPTTIPNKRSESLNRGRTIPSVVPNS